MFSEDLVNFKRSQVSLSLHSGVGVKGKLCCADSMYIHLPDGHNKLKCANKVKVRHGLSYPLWETAHILKTYLEVPPL